MQKLIIIGAGGHGKVCGDIAHKMNLFDKIVYLDDIKEYCLDFQVIGNIQDFILYQDFVFFVAIGDNQKRIEIVKKLPENRIISLIDPSAVISSYSYLGKGTCVMPNAVINAGCNIGKGCIINTAATIDHDCNLKDGVHISPGAHLGGNCNIGYLSWIGLGANIKNGIKIGDNSMIGSGSVVINDLTSNITVAGVPAKKLKD